MPDKRPWIGPLLGLLGVLGGYFASIYIEEQKSEDKLVQMIYQQHADVSREMQQLREDFITQQFQSKLEILELQALLAERFDANQLLKDYLDGMYHPAWIKVLDEDKNKFVMWHINDAYEEEFDVSKERYVGKTDFDVGRWPESVALIFEENDFMALEYADTVCRQEPVTLRSGETTMGISCKWPLTLEGKKAIAGQIFLPQHIEVIKGKF